MTPSPAQPRSSSSSRARPGPAGFTLVELLSVIAIIGILSSIAFTVMKSVNERKDIAHAKADLSTIQMALDSFKRQYGDYPQTKVDTELFDALTGKRGPMQAFTSAASYGKVFLTLGKLTLSNSDPKSVDSVGVNAVVDPWGHNYFYVYKSPVVGWKNPDYVLYSAGPDGKENVTIDSGGYPIITTDSSNQDNVYTHD